MVNITGKIIGSAADRLNKLDKKINFSVPKRVVNYLGKNGKEDDSKLNLGADNFRLQIGKMTDDDDTIYSEDVIIEALNYLLKKVKSGNQIVIQVWADLAERTRNPGEEDMSKPLSFQEEKYRIEKIIKKHFPNQYNQVRIVNVSENYPELFDFLEGGWIYTTKKAIYLNPRRFTAVDIAKYLYKAAQDDPNFMKLVYGTKVDWRQLQDSHEPGSNNSDYYALIEIAIRLYEILKGINIQGGVERQKKYDQIIGLIWHGEDQRNPKLSFKNVPSLKSLHNFCKKVAPNIPFQRVYIENSEVEEIAGKKAEKVKTVRNRIWVTAVVASMLVGAFSSNYIGKMSRDKKLKSDLNLAIDNKLKNISVYPKFEHKNWGAMDQEDAIKALRNRSGEIADDFATYFARGKLSQWGDGTLTKERIQLMVLNTIDQENVDILYDSEVEMADYYFLVNNVLPKNSLNISPYGISLVPYDYLDPYVYAMKNTSSVVDDVYFFLQDYDYKTLREESSTKGLDVIDEFGDYKTRDGSIYRLALQSGSDGSKHLVAAWGDEETAPVEGSSMGEWGKTGKIKYSAFTKEFGKIVTTDFLRQRHPEAIVLRDMFNTYLGTSFSDNYINKLDSSGTSLILQRERFVDLLLWYLQDQNIPIDPNVKTYQEDVYHLMTMFIHDKQPDLKALGINTMPYNQYLPYKDAFENTTSKESQTYISKHHLESFGTSDLYDKYPHEYLKQPYISEDGSAYLLVVVTIDGKRYIYATRRRGFYDKEQIDQIYYYAGADVSQKILDERQQYSSVE